MKTKTLIRLAVTAKLICVFVFAYAKSRFSHDEAQMFLCDVPHNFPNFRTPLRFVVVSGGTAQKTDRTDPLGEV